MRTVESFLAKSFAEDLEVIHSIRNIFSANKNVSKKQFHDFVTNSLMRHQELQAVEYMIRLPKEKRKQYEKHMRSQGFSNFHIKEQIAGKEMRKAGERDEYYVIHYIEPFEGNEAALGYDVSFTAPARETLNHAKALGIGVSPWLNLAQGDVGFVVYMNIPETDGFSVGVFRLKRFIENAIKNDETRGIDFIIEEVVNDRTSRIFEYDSAQEKVVELDKHAPVSVKHARQFKVGNQTWRLTPTFSLPDHSALHPLWSLVAAMMVLLLTLSCAFFLKERDHRIKAQTAAKIREEFMTVASHELKTPLTPLKMEIFLAKELLLVKSGYSQEKVISLLDKANKQLNDIVELIDDLLDVGRISEGKFPFHFTEFDFAELINSIVEKFTPTLNSKGCSVELDLEKNVNVYWDIIRVEQVIVNVLSNAIKFAANSPIKIRMYTENGMVFFRVKDQGIGISAEMQKKIFDRFERGVSTNSYGGLGLGLFIVREIIQGHGGTVRVESIPGDGAEFIFQVPIKNV